MKYSSLHKFPINPYCILKIWLTHSLFSKSSSEIGRIAPGSPPAISTSLPSRRTDVDELTNPTFALALARFFSSSLCISEFRWRRRYSRLSSALEMRAVWWKRLVSKTSLLERPSCNHHAYKLYSTRMLKKEINLVSGVYLNGTFPVESVLQCCWLKLFKS